MEKIFLSENEDSFKELIEKALSTSAKVLVWQKIEQSEQRTRVMSKIKEFNQEDAKIVLCVSENPFHDGEIYAYCKKLKLLFKTAHVRSEVDINVDLPEFLMILTQAEEGNLLSQFQTEQTEKQPSFGKTSDPDMMVYEGQRENIKDEYDTHDTSADRVEDKPMDGSTLGEEKLDHYQDGTTLGAEKINNIQDGATLGAETLETHDKGDTLGTEKIDKNQQGIGHTEKQSTTMKGSTSGGEGDIGKNELMKVKSSGSSDNSKDEIMKVKSLGDEKVPPPPTAAIDEDELYADKREAPRAKVQGERQVTVSKKEGDNPPNIYPVYDFSAGGMAFLVFSETEFAGGDIIFAHGLDTKKFDKPMMAVVRSVREADDIRIQYKIGCQFIESEDEI